MYVSLFTGKYWSDIFTLSWLTCTVSLKTNHFIFIVCCRVTGRIWRWRTTVCCWSNGSSIRLASRPTRLSTQLRRWSATTQRGWSGVLLCAGTRCLYGPRAVSTRRWIPVCSWTRFSGQWVCDVFEMRCRPTSEVTICVQFIVHCVSKKGHFVFWQQLCQMLTDFHKILSLLERRWNLQQNMYKNFYQTLSMFLHYLVKYKRLKMAQIVQKL